MTATPNIRNHGLVDGLSEPRPLRSKELLELQRSYNTGSRNRSQNPENREECGPVFKTPDMRIPSIIITQSVLRPKELLERIERSRSASKIPLKSPETRQQTWERQTTPDVSTLNGAEPMRTKELLEKQRSWHQDSSALKLAYYKKLSSPMSRQDRDELMKTPEKRPAAVTTHSEIRLERPKELLKRLEKSKCKSASASKIHSMIKFLTPENRQRTWEEPKTPEMRCPCPVEPAGEVRPLRTKELLERQRQATITSRSASASKIETKRTKAAVAATSCTASRLLVPSIGFSYPKDPKTCPSSTLRQKPIAKLTNTKRNLFHQKETLQQKLERITGEWQRMTEQQLRQLILDFVNLCLPSSGAKCSHLSKDCYVNQLMEALQQLRYPREVNKTWLRMPKSQQAIGHVLEILRFLLDLVSDDREMKEGIFPIDPDGKEVLQHAARAFRLTHGCTEQKLERPAEAHGTSFDLFSLQVELENVELQPKDPDLSSESFVLQQEKQRLQEELAICQAEIKLSASASSENVQKLGHLYMKNLSQGQQLEKIQERVRNQTCSFQDYGKMLDQREELTQELQLQRLRLQEFAERLRLSTLKLKRCQKEQKESIEAFNVCIRDYEYSLASKPYPISMQLSSNATLAEIEEIIQRLKENRELLESSPVKHLPSTPRKPLGEISHTPH